MERNSLFIGQSFEDVSLFESGKRQLSISEVCLVAIIWRFTGNPSDSTTKRASWPPGDSW